MTSIISSYQAMTPGTNHGVVLWELRVITVEHLSNGTLSDARVTWKTIQQIISNERPFAIF